MVIAAKPQLHQEKRQWRQYKSVGHHDGAESHSIGKNESTGNTEWYIVEYEDEALPALEGIERPIRIIRRRSLGRGFDFSRSDLEIGDAKSLIEALRDAWFSAPDLAGQKDVAIKMQRQAFQDVPYYPLGIYFQSTAFRDSLAGVLPGYSLFYNVRRA